MTCAQEIHVGCLYNIHKSHTPILEDEPKNVDIKKLIDFKINATHARTSILGFVEILRNKGDGVADRGAENKDLGIQDGSAKNNEEIPIAVPRPSVTEGGLHTLLHTDSSSAQNRLQDSDQSHSFAPRPGTASLLETQHQDQENQLLLQPAAEYFYPNDLTEHDDVTEEQNSLDVCHPFFNPTMLDLFPNGEMPDLSHFETSLLSLNYFDLEDWNMGSNVMDQASDN